MKTLNRDDLTNINGGISLTALKYIGVGLAAVGTFIASVVYGYLHPNAC